MFSKSCFTNYMHLSNKIHAFEKQKEYMHAGVIGLFYYTCIHKYKMCVLQGLNMCVVVAIHKSGTVHLISFLAS